MEIKYLEVIVMGNGELLNSGRTVGFVNDEKEEGLYTKEEILEKFKEKK